MVNLSGHNPSKHFATNVGFFLLFPSTHCKDCHWSPPASHGLGTAIMSIRSPTIRPFAAFYHNTGGNCCSSHMRLDLGLARDDDDKQIPSALFAIPLRHDIFTALHSLQCASLPSSFLVYTLFFTSLRLGLYNQPSASSMFIASLLALGLSLVLLFGPVTIIQIGIRRYQPSLKRNIKYHQL